MSAATELSSLANQFQAFAKYCARDGAPRYETICNATAEELDVLSILTAAPVEQRRPNLLLAAVHELLLRGINDPLSEHYPTVHPAVGELFDQAALTSAFLHFCRIHRDELIDVVAVRSTQTNEVGRTAVLLPAFAAVARLHARPLAILELGSSAGLNLLFDHYSYRYSQDPDTDFDTDRDEQVRLIGNPTSAVVLNATFRNGILPELSVPEIGWRKGVDLHPIDPRDLAESRWLLACQWPDHPDRFARLDAALAYSRSISDPPQVARGDMIEMLDSLTAQVPDELQLCIFHTWAAAYLSEPRQEELSDVLRSLASQRPISWLFAENPEEIPGLPLPPMASENAPPRGSTALALFELDGSSEQSCRLADVHPHGRWISWWGSTITGDRAVSKI